MNELTFRYGLSLFQSTIAILIVAGTLAGTTLMALKADSTLTIVNRIELGTQSTAILFFWILSAVVSLGLLAMVHILVKLITQPVYVSIDEHYIRVPRSQLSKEADQLRWEDVTFLKESSVKPEVLWVVAEQANQVAIIQARYLRKKHYKQIKQRISDRLPHIEIE
ncbi:hypothetical protein ROA7450_01040 [Roseovarius albus]|uniref:Uncharacterized protein n=1 Tax=Roseovarius albus TaxID=1247867 RepID=A0A1X6YM21_9RHOB|nr:hypothetical protein [Roseovarius albus]SLN25086.1 hypothetical protein ROA7450_01040 [Roseovarius albus]